MHRLANALLTQNVAVCIFLGSAPAFSRFDLDILLPSCEESWEAKSPEECLACLQRAPTPVLLSVAMNQLRCLNLQGDNGPAFETSVTGMFTLVNGLHCLVWNATLYEMEPRSTTASTVAVREQLSILLRRLAKNFSGHTIEALTAQAVTLSGNEAIVNANKALDRWLQAWNTRLFREEVPGNSGFSSDPLPFWWLAKLFLLLHICAAVIPTDSEFDALKSRGDNLRGVLERQVKIFGFLSRIRRVQKGGFAKASLNDSLVSLMEPNCDDRGSIGLY